jgi:hypothetical protein
MKIKIKLLTIPPIIEAAIELPLSEGFDEFTDDVRDPDGPADGNNFPGEIGVNVDKVFIFVNGGIAGVGDSAKTPIDEASSGGGCGGSGASLGA